MMDFTIKKRQYIVMRRIFKLLGIASLFLYASSTLFLYAEDSPAAVKLFAGASASLPITWAAENPALMHRGCGLGGGAELDIGRIIALRLGADYFWFSASTVSPEGVLYRAWEGLRFSLESGYRFTLSGMTINALAGAALSASYYSGTSLVFAYPSLRVGAELDLQFLKHGAIRFGLPLEVMFRGAYTSFAAGLSAVYVYSFPIGGAK
jgi:hypothetical protein